MRVARLEITRFRGFESFVLCPGRNVVVVGEPRAGRSDLIAALRRVLEPRSVQSRPTEWDVLRPVPDPPPPDGDEDARQLTTVEVSLLALPDETEQRLQDRLELLDPTTGELTDESNRNAELGIRLRYCLDYDPDEPRLEHWIEYPKSGNRVPRVERELLRAFVVDRNPPLQLRAEGLFRQLANEPDPVALGETLRAFGSDIADATQRLADSDEVQTALALVTDQGADLLLELDGADPTAAVGFTAEDGSLTALLRAVQPTLDLDNAGTLPLGSHGSTTSAVLAAAEASAAAQTLDAIVLADDFGDQLDAASGEYVAARLRHRSGQLWLTTRQPEVLRAFDATELLRLTRRTGTREFFMLAARARIARNVYVSAIFSRCSRPRCQREPSCFLKALTTSRPTGRSRGGCSSNTACRYRRVRRAPRAASGSGGQGGKQELLKIALLADGARPRRADRSSTRTSRNGRRLIDDLVSCRRAGRAASGTEQSNGRSSPACPPTSYGRLGGHQRRSHAQLDVPSIDDTDLPGDASGR